MIPSVGDRIEYIGDEAVVEEIEVATGALIARIMFSEDGRSAQPGGIVYIRSYAWDGPTGQKRWVALW